MQTVNEPYNSIIASGDYRTEVRLKIGDDYVYDSDYLSFLSTDCRLFPGETPEIGCCVSGEINVELYEPGFDIPRQAQLQPEIRVTDGVNTSEWIKKGVFWLDTRQTREDGSGLNKLILHGYDSMLKAEQDYPSSKLAWPADDKDVVNEIAAYIGVTVDPRTISIMNAGYKIPLDATTEYNCREILGYIAASYCGNFIMSDDGELRLVKLNEFPAETNYLVTASGDVITFGGVKILV